MKTTLNIVILLALLLVSCKQGNQKSAQELADEEAFRLDSIAAVQMDDENYDEEFGEGPSDDEIQEYGLFISVDDGGYPFYSVTVEFPEREMTASFTVNLENLGINSGALESLKDKYVTFYYTSELENDLYEMLLDDNSVLGEDAIEISEDLKAVTGILSGAGSVTGGDLPTNITVTPSSGEKVVIALYINPEMVQANGKEVTAYYNVRGRQEITFINISE
jgi:hypothetical protein